MTNETTPEETVTAINALKAKFVALPWKKIAIGTAAATAAAAIVVFTKKFEEPSYEIEITETTPDGELHVEMTPVTD